WMLGLAFRLLEHPCRRGADERGRGRTGRVAGELEPWWIRACERAEADDGGGALAVRGGRCEASRSDRAERAAGGRDEDERVRREVGGEPGGGLEGPERGRCPVGVVA